VGGFPYFYGMNVLIFNGCSDYKLETTGRRIAGYLHEQLAARNFDVTEFHISEAHIPFFDLHETEPTEEVREMCGLFLRSELQVWLTPLYHGGMTGVMKNCLDWLELTARLEKPYLTDKIVGLVAWADGGQAMQGINAMDAVAKALRAWVVPYTVPLVKQHLYLDTNRHEFAAEHTRKLERLVSLLTDARQLFAKSLFALLIVSFWVFGARAQQPGIAQQPTTQLLAMQPSAVKVTGEVTTPLTLTAPDLDAMPQTNDSARDRQGVMHKYSGVAIADILNKAGVTTGKQLRGKNMAKYLLVSCADNYQVVFSLAELDPSITERVVILADKEDGKPLAAGTGPFKLIVPGEKRPARNCFQVTGLFIGVAKE
jgi:arsenic resistance protein ArsH